MWALCTGTLTFWMPVPLARSVGSRIPRYPDQAGRLRRVVLGCRLLTVRSNAGSKRRWGWPYSDPRAAGVSGVNAGESLAPCRGPAGQDSRSQAQ